MNHSIELKIEKLVYGGYGLAFADGRAYFILNALPGETVRAMITREKKNVSFGKAMDILVRSPLRIEPPCPHFMACGGCHLQHLEYSEQVRFKEEMLRETFRRLAQMMLPEIEIVQGEPWHYRTRAQFKVFHEREEAVIGFFAAQSHRIHSIDRCLLLAERLNELLDGLQQEKGKLAAMRRAPEEIQLRTNNDESESAVDFLGEPPEFEFLNRDETLSSAGELIYSTAFGSFRISSNSFFQVNRFLVERLVENALGDATGRTALDLFSGVGLFTVSLSRRFKNVVAVEESPGAVSDLAENLRLNECKNVETVGANVSVLLNWGAERWSEVDFVLLDPPRQGVEKRVTQKLAEARVPRCAYVSCDPTSMARDLKMLCGAGYIIEKVFLLDFFPQTYHFETIVRLRRAGSGSF